jgi:hypothetical protein
MRDDEEVDRFERQITKLFLVIFVVFILGFIATSYLA